MIPVASRGEDRCLNGGPVVHHLAVAEMQHPVSERREPRVPDSIPFKCRGVGVVLATIDFDHQPVPDQNVYPNSRGERYLDSDG